MMKQPDDRFTALKDKRDWTEIRKDPGYWQGFWKNRAAGQRASVHVLRRAKS